MEVEQQQQQQQQLAFYSKGRTGRLDSVDDEPELEDIKPQLVDVDSSSSKQQQQQQPRIRLASSVVSVATIIKTEPAEQQRLQRLSKAVALGLNGSSRIGRSRSNSSTTPSPTPAGGGAMHHPISLSLLQQHSQQQAAAAAVVAAAHQIQHSPFYSGVTSPASSAPSPGSNSSISASPLKRIRHIVNNNNSSNSNGQTAMEDWLPSPGQMSVDSMSPPPPSSSSSMMTGQPGSSGPHHNHHLHSNGHGQQQQQQQPSSVISSSNGGYSPSPMSTGSYEPPYSPAGSSSHASVTAAKSGREDLSPPGSVNGVGGGGSAGYSTDGYVGGGSDSKKKKGPVPRQQEELCLVCGDRASGYHYNALTCEGCKGFFRRSITKNAVYQCKYGNGCDIDMYMRRKCQECRLKKCLTVGMRPECVVPEYQCAVKREAKKAQKEKDRPSSSAMGSPDMKEQEVKAVSAPASVAPQHHHHQQVNHHHHQHSAHLHHQQQQQQQMMMIHVTEEKPMSVGSVTSGSVGTPMSSLVKPLSPEQEELINRLVYFQEEFDQPSEEDLRKISSSGMHESESEAKFKHITEMTILTVQLTVEFSKRLPGFDTLLREDQITLLKACSSEVMMLRCARRYDANTDSIVFANNLPYTRDSYNVAGVGDNAEPLFHFGKQMSTMKVDNAEYALITAIVIFSERPGLVEARKVEKIQEIYLEALQAYVMNHRVRPMTEFAKLLSVLTELRTLGNLNSEMCFSLKLKNKKLPPFLAEIWDVHS